MVKLIERERIKDQKVKNKLIESNRRTRKDGFVWPIILGKHIIECLKTTTVYSRKKAISRRYLWGKEATPNKIRR